MKLVLTLVFIFSAIWVHAEDIPQEENRAVNVRVFGGFTGFDPDGYKVVRAAMATLIVEGTVDHFITKAYGHEGGHEFCVELTPDPSIHVDKITKMLAVITPANHTAYEYEEVKTCR